ncbi:Glutamyl-Q tRNA(Asp) synthetase [Rhodospirillaceae bacterium LM-1]|nr:Glutamyl-Q tRNA(Asp) synthetase [Rhodospirillaceae bacterium LM-1]
MTFSSPVTRFAPSPTGFLHLGHAFCALFAHGQAVDRGGRFLLRIEDIDPVRCKLDFETAIYEDLSWLGLTWEMPVRRQSDHLADYRQALDRLEGMGLLYPCFCSRKDIASSGQAPHGPDGPLYPGICKRLSLDQRAERIGAGQPFALRLEMERAVALAGALTWRDLDQGEQKARPEIFGDVVLARKDAPTSYHLAVTLDDHLQEVTLVTRGVDLFEATHVHRLLQALLGLNVPAWRHHPLLMGPSGLRLAKRDQAQSLRALRNEGLSPQAVRSMAMGRESANP